MKLLLVVHRRPVIAKLKSRSFAVSMLVACLLLLANPDAHGQQQSSNIMNVGDTTSTPIPGDGHDYIHMLSETVNPANGSVSLRIELPVPKGRGITPSFSIDYDSNSVHHLEPSGGNPGFANWFADGDSMATNITPPSGWSYGLPSLYYNQGSVQEGEQPNTYSCATYSNYMFTDVSGGQHALGLATEFASGGTDGTCGGNIVAQNGDTQVQAALTQMEGDQNNPSARRFLPATVSTAEGTVYKFSGYNSNGVQTNVLPDTVEDRNGNILNFTDNGPSGVLINDSFSVTDAAGRPVISTSGLQGTTETLVVGGLTYTIYWTSVSANASVESQWAGLGTGPPSGFSCSGIPAIQDTQRAISQIVLPNTQSYHFYYGTNTLHGSPNPYGLLNEIDYPSGAWVTYTWKLSDNYNELADYPSSYPLVEECTDPSCSQPSVTVFEPIVNGCLYQYTSPVVATRTIGYSSGSTAAQTQTFKYTTSWGPTGTSTASVWNLKTTNLITTDKVRSGNNSATTNYTYQPGGVPSNDPLNPGVLAPEVPLENTIQYYDYSSGQPGTLLETVQKTWTNNPSGPNQNPTWLQDELLSSTTTPTGGSASTVTYSYAASPFALVTAKNETDGLTGATHITNTMYQPFTGTPGDLVDRPCKVTICSSATSCLAETDYLYDGGTSVCGAAGGASTSSVIGGTLPSGTHDETLFGTSASTPRGNVTEQISYPGSGPSLATMYTYDETGQILTMTDPNNNQTQYAYKDSPSGGNSYGDSNAYLTQITYPPANGVVHQENFQYNYGTGYLTEADDENGQPTDYTYADPFDRLTEVQGPPDFVNNNMRPTTNYGYTDAPPSPTITKSVLQDTSNTLRTSVQTMDGMGHVVQTQLTSDPDGVDTVNTTYDGEGNVYTVSNPFRTTGDPTYGLTTYTYDALNRKTLQVNQESPNPTTESWAYSGNTVTFTNEDGKAWQRTYDSFGNLTRVIEPSPGTTTNYTYDTLNDLTGVTQGTGTPETRSFTYDGLARLLTATNPESGTTTYSYLNASGGLCSGDVSDVCSKTDARGVTTAYSYDVLNRLTGKAYSDGTTPAVSFGYDVVPPSMSNNTFGYYVGRLSQASLTISGMPYMSYLSAGYDDATGKPFGYVECEGDPTCATNQTVPVGVAGGFYDLAGDVLTSSAAVVNTLASSSPNDDAAGALYTYDAAGHVSSVVALAEADEQPETDVNLFSSPVYGAMGLTSAQLPSNSTTQTTPINLSRTYDKRGRISGETDLGGAGQSSVYSYTVGYDGVGNVTSFNDSVMGTWNMSSGAGYDALNRLTTATATAGNYAGLTLTEAYDVYGNRTAQTPSGNTQALVPTASTLFYNAKNQINGLSYDAAGNLIDDGTNQYLYDGEGRVCAVYAYQTPSSMTEYIYDPMGNRVAKGAISTFSCNSVTNGFTFTNLYVDDLQGRQLLETSGWSYMLHANFFLNGQLLATNDNGTNWYYNLNDWVGTKRVVANMDGSADVGYVSLPYGDGQQAIAPWGPDDTEHHFTGKVRDVESGNDYFLARYYSSNIGRFLTPDWSAQLEPVPYAKLDNPQSLNLYSYVLNNPLTALDSDGHEIIYASGLKNEQVVRDTVQAILADPHTSSNLSGYVGANSPNLIIQSGDLSSMDSATQNPDGTPGASITQGNTSPDIQTTTSSSTDSNGVTTTSAPQTTLTGTTITIDNRTSAGDTPGVMVHESVHAGEANANPGQFNKDAAAEKSLPHDQRPQEQRANAAQKAFGPEIKKEVKQIERHRKNEEDK